MRAPTSCTNGQFRAQHNRAHRRTNIASTKTMIEQNAGAFRHQADCSVHIVQQLSLARAQRRAQQKIIKAAKKVGSPTAALESQLQVTHLKIQELKTQRKTLRRALFNVLTAKENKIK